LIDARRSAGIPAREDSMHRLISGVAAAAVALLFVALPGARAFERTPAEIFAVLPPGSTGPEGLTVGPDGNVYVTTFGFNNTGVVNRPGQLFVFNRNGRLLRQVTVKFSSPNLLGLAFHPTTGALLIIDFGNKVVLNVDKTTGANTPFMTLPPAFTANAGLNALTFDKGGNVYVSDSFQGIIWRTGPAGGQATAWVTDTTTLTTPGVPPFGANGLAFNKAQDALFVANTGNDTVVRIPVTNGTAGIPAVFVNSINGADGLAIDGQDNIWVCANQSDEIVVLDPTGKVIAKLGDFDGVVNGTPRGLLFPASLDFLGDELLVTNLALDLRLVNPAFKSIDSEWAAEVVNYTVSKIRARIPPFPDEDGHGR
jgi:sugar lactone lactonase YvrE